MGVEKHHVVALDRAFRGQSPGPVLGEGKTVNHVFLGLLHWMAVAVDRVARANVEQEGDRLAQLFERQTGAAEGLPQCGLYALPPGPSAPRREDRNTSHAQLQGAIYGMSLWLADKVGHDRLWKAAKEAFLHELAWNQLCATPAGMVVANCERAWTGGRPPKLIDHSADRDAWYRMFAGIDPPNGAPDSKKGFWAGKAPQQVGVRALRDLRDRGILAMPSDLAPTILPKVRFWADFHVVRGNFDGADFIYTWTDLRSQTNGSASALWRAGEATVRHFRPQDQVFESVAALVEFATSAAVGIHFPPADPDWKPERPRKPRGRKAS